MFRLAYCGQAFPFQRPNGKDECTCVYITWHSYHRLQSEGHCLVLPHVPSARTFLISQNPSLSPFRCERFTCPQLQSWTIPFNTWNDKNTSSVLFPGHRTSFLSWLFTKNTILPILERYQVTIVTCYSLDYTFRGYVLKTSFCLTIVLTVGVTVEYSRTYLSKQAKSYRRT